MRILRRSTVSILAIALLAFTGCATLSELLGGTPKPSAKVTGVRITDFSLSDLTLAFDVAVSNPYPVALPLVNMDFALASQGKPFLQGLAPLQGAVPAKGSQTVSMPAKITFSELIKAVQGVRPGAMVPYQTTLGLSVNAPAVGKLRLPLQKEGQLPVPTAPNVSVSSIKWQNVSLAGATGQIALRVANPNSFAFALSNLNYNVKLGGFDLANGGLVNAANLAAGAAQEIGINVSVSSAKAGMGLLQLLQGKSSNYTLGGSLAIGTPFGPLQIPLAVSGQVPLTR